MSKAEKTKEFIIERSAPVFNRKGYAGTSLSDIMAITGLTKGSVYGNFANKNEVAIAVYQYNTKGLAKRFAEAMKDKRSAAGKLLAFTDYYRANWKSVFERGGCPIQNASVEADDNALFLKKHVQASIKSWVADIEKIIEEGRSTGEFKKSSDAKQSAYAIITILEGGIMLSKIMNNQDLLFAALDRIVALVNNELKK
jgi:TetR/AcrR family transcriptional repressor of nem operon